MNIRIAAEPFVFQFTGRAPEACIVHIVMARLVSLLLSVLVLAPACGDDASGAYLQAGGTAESDGMGEEETANKDGEVEGNLSPTALIECELETPCEFPFVGTGFAKDSAASFSASDLCVFATLARGELALVETVAEFSDATARLDYVITGPGVALRQASGESEGGGRWQKGVFRCELQTAAFFTACLQAPSADCLDPEQWVVGCEPLDNLVCPG